MGKRTDPEGPDDECGEGEGMDCRNDPSFEQMEKDLRQAGWQKTLAMLWISPQGVHFRGPHKAWHLWHGGLEEWASVVEQRDALARKE